MSEEQGVLYIMDNQRGDWRKFWKRLTRHKDLNLTVPPGAADAHGPSPPVLIPEIETPDVAAARAAFNEKLAEGYEAYELKGGSMRNARQLFKFDPSVRFIVLSPKQQGGRQSGYS